MESTVQEKSKHEFNRTIQYLNKFEIQHKIPSSMNNYGNPKRKLTRHEFMKICTFNKFAEMITDLIVEGKPFNNQNITTKEYVVEWLNEEYNPNHK